MLDKLRLITRPVATEGSMLMFIRRIVIRNYKSIVSCDVNLGSLMFLVGPNGSGKSNFLDAIRFVSDSMALGIDHALTERSGITEVLSRYTPLSRRDAHFGIRLEFTLPSEHSGHYAFRVGLRPGGGFNIQREECVFNGSANSHPVFFRVKDGSVDTNVSLLAGESDARASKHNLFLSTLLPYQSRSEFHMLHDALDSMHFYNINPYSFRNPQEAESVNNTPPLFNDGSNLNSVLRNLANENEGAIRRIFAYLRKIVPTTRSVRSVFVGDRQTLQFVADDKGFTTFYASSMSPGTLRVLAILVALFQALPPDGINMPVVSIEEPEATVHPAAAGILFESFREASKFTQILATSHSPDLLDNKDIEADSLLAVASNNGQSHIAPLNEASRSMIKDQLLTAGEILRMNQAYPTPSTTTKADLFDD